MQLVRLLSLVLTLNMIIVEQKVLFLIRIVNVSVNVMGDKLLLNFGAKFQR